jgi:undecaprenyl-diphosphatase
VSAAAPAAARPVVRRPADLVLALVGALLLVLASLPVDAARLSPAEGEVFPVLNAHTVLPFWAVWALMQLGNLLVVPAAAAAAAVLRQWRLAAGLLLAGLGTYLGAKVVKGIVVRGRPDDLIADVVIRGAPAAGRGFPSGHAAVVVALVTVAWPWLGPRGRVICAALAAIVCLARVYVGAHLPLDVVAGAALGLAVGGVVRLLLGRPA